MKIKHFYFLFLVILLLSCSSSDDDKDYAPEVFGIWAVDTTKESTLTLFGNNPEQSSGIKYEFQSDGDLIVHKYNKSYHKWFLDHVLLVIDDDKYFYQVFWSFKDGIIEQPYHLVITSLENNESLYLISE